MEISSTWRPASAGGCRLRRLIGIGIGLGLLLPALPAAAAPTCLLDNPGKLCVSFDAVIPPDRVQPAGEGGTPTYVDYSLTLRNLGQTSTRNVSFAMTLTPQARIAEFSASHPGCTVSATAVSCQYDKLVVQQGVTFDVLVEVPALQAPDQPDYPLINTVTFGWNGNTQTASYTNTVSVYGAASYVPPGQQVTLVTGPEQPDRALQTDAGAPLWAKLTIPAEDHPGLYATLAVVDDGPTFDCATGIYTQTTGDIGFYVCRDTGQPNRWVRSTTEPHWQFEPGNPLTWELVWDTSIVPPLQLPPTPLAPTGTPPFAVFHRGGEDGAATTAWARTCDAHAPPCIDRVEQYGSADWGATFLKRAVGAEPEDGTQEDLLCVLIGCFSTQGLIPPIGEGLVK